MNDSIAQTTSTHSSSAKAAKKRRNRIQLSSLPQPPMPNITNPCTLRDRSGKSVDFFRQILRDTFQEWDNFLYHFLSAPPPASSSLMDQSSAIQQGNVEEKAQNPAAIASVEQIDITPTMQKEQCVDDFPNDDSRNNSPTGWGSTYQISYGHS